MEYRQLGQSDPYVSTLCVGCRVFAGDGWGEQPEADSIATVHAASPAPLNFRSCPSATPTRSA